MRIIITEDEQVYADEQQMMEQECKNKTLEMAYLYTQGSIVTNFLKNKEITIKNKSSFLV